MRQHLMVARDVVIAIFSAIGKSLLAMQYSVLEGNHYLVQFTEQRHQLLYTQLFGICTNGTSGDALVTGALVRLTDKINLEGGRILRFLFRSIPFGVFYNAFLVFCLAFFGV